MKGFVSQVAILFLALAVHADYTDDCITFSSAGSFTLKTKNEAKNWDGTLWTSGDKSNWTEWNGGEVTATRKDDAWNLYVRGDTNNTVISSQGSPHRKLSWVLTTNGTDMVDCSGNIETLRGAVGNAPSPTVMGERCYDGLFYGNYGLKSAPNLTATNLSIRCYDAMFMLCKGLETAPALPAKNMELDCYQSMFLWCSSLRTPPALPSTELADYCYGNMFFGCSSLNSVPSLPATNLTYGCYYAMFSGCSALTNAPALPATDLHTNCYYSMFSGCKRLRETPLLPAKVLKENCYYSMFQNCTGLKLAHALPAHTAAEYCYRSMFQGCSSLETPPAILATNLADTCYGWMFQECKSLKTAPELPAKRLAKGCYYRMFYDCSSLVINNTPHGKIWKLPELEVGADYSTYEMFKGTAGNIGTWTYFYYLCSPHYIASAPAQLDVAAVEGTSFSVTTNGVSTVDLPCVITYATPIKIVYTAQDGFMFPDGTLTFTTNVVINSDLVTVQLPQDQTPILKPVDELIEKPLAVDNLVYNGFIQQGITNIDDRLIIMSGATSSVNVVVTNSTFALPANVVSTAKILGTNYYWKGETESVAKTNDIIIAWSLAPRSISIKSADATKIFDGLPLTSNEVNVIDGGFANSEMFLFTVTGKQTGIGWSTNFYTFADNEDTGTKTNNYAVTQDYGILTILPIPMVTIDTNGLGVADTTYSLFTNGTKVVANELGQYVVVSNEIIALKYDVTSDGAYFTDGSTKYDVAFNADTLVTIPALLVKKPDSPKSPNMKLGAVAQRYPWNGILDVQYWAKNMPNTGYDIVLTVKLPDGTDAKTLVYSQSYPALNGKHTVDFDARGAFGEVVVPKGVKVTAKLIPATP